MKKVKARVFEILTDPPEGDRIGNAIFNSILILISVNVAVCIVETVESLGKAFPDFFTGSRSFRSLSFPWNMSCASGPAPLRNDTAGL